MNSATRKTANQPVDDEVEFYDDEIDGCLHGVPWTDPCPECEDEEDALDGIY